MHREGYEAAVRAALEDRRRAEAILRATTNRLRREMNRARDEGATIPQLMAWTGYSRRRVYQLLRP